MSEGTPEAPAQEPTDQAPASWEDMFKGEDPAKVREALDNSRKWEQRAKDNYEARQKLKELEKAQQASMTEAERAVAEAEARGRTAAAQEYGKRLATSEIRAAAADAGADLTGVFDFLDLGRFVTEDGEPDPKAIKTFVARLPKKDQGPPSFDGGTRSTAPPAPSMTQLIRQAAGRA